MAMAGVLALKLGCKAGTIAGLVQVALGGFWFIPATRIRCHGAPGNSQADDRSIGFLAGVASSRRG